MKNKILLTSICTMLSFGAFAEDMPQPPMGGPNGGGPRGGIGMIQQLTDEQKSCIEAYGCKMPEKPAMDEQKEKPSDERPDNGERPEMSAEQQESMECMQKAMESCGIEMPERPEKPSGEKPPRPNGERPERQNGERPEHKISE